MKNRNKLAASLAQAVFWAIWLILAAPIDFNDPWTYFAVITRLIGAVWFVLACQDSQRNYRSWKDERFHKHIHPILTEPPEMRH